MGELKLARENESGQDRPGNIGEGDPQKIEEDPQLSSPPPTPRGQPCAGRFCVMEGSGLRGWGDTGGQAASGT